MKSTSKNIPEELDVLGQLGNATHILKVRIVRFQHPLIGKSKPFLDIRRYFVDKKNEDGTLWTGFGPGISFSITDVKKLQGMLGDVIKRMESHGIS